MGQVPGFNARDSVEDAESFRWCLDPDHHDGAEEAPLVGGWATAGVVRVGETVRRPAGARSERVAELLRYLERVGFAGAPRFIGYDKQGRETLTFIEGDVPSDCRSIIWRDDQVAASMRLLRGFHDQTADSELADGAEVVCHNDYGPWNLVWRAELPVAMIDFDNAAPGARLDDLGYAAWKYLNLGLRDVPALEQRRRLSLLAHSYGAQRDAELLAAIRAAQARMRRLIESAALGTRRDQALVLITGEEQWLDDHGPMLASLSRA